MAKVYAVITAKVKLSAKATYEYTCENCGTKAAYTVPYSEEFEATVSDSPYGDHTVARIKAERMAMDKATMRTSEIKKRYPTFDTTATHLKQPCPNCGYTQSWIVEWIKKARKSNAIVFSIASFFVWLLIVLAALGPVGFFGLFLAAILAFATYFLLIYIFFNLFDPNKDFDNIETRNLPQVTWSEIEISPTYA